MVFWTKLNFEKEGKMHFLFSFFVAVVNWYIGCKIFKFPILPVMLISLIGFLGGTFAGWFSKK